jgi:hypothetical protein
VRCCEGRQRAKLGYFCFEEEPGRRSAVKIPPVGIAVLAFGLSVEDIGAAFVVNSS